MTPREIAQNVAERAVTELRGIVRENIADHQARPVYWLAFHSEMAANGPKIWRPWHRWRARRAKAAVKALGLSGQCNAAIIKARAA